MLTCGFLEPSPRDVVCITSKSLDSALCVERGLVLASMHKVDAVENSVILVLMLGLASCLNFEPSDVLRCCCIASWLTGDTFSGRRMGHSSSVGLPASASTSVRCALSGLFGSITCATGGLGRGLSQKDAGLGFFTSC